MMCKTKFLVHNTLVGDVALTNISREAKYFHGFVQYAKQKFFAFPQLIVCS